MAGTPGNPNHDQRTGRFTSKSGLNKSNSTLGQRGKARVKEQVSAGKAFVLGAAGVAAAAAGTALLQGVTKPIRIRGTVLAHQAINAAEAHAVRLVAAHGPTIAKAIKDKGSSLINHVKNMKSAGAIQHQSQAPYTPGPSAIVKPRVRVPMGRQAVAAPKPRRRK